LNENVFFKRTSAFYIIERTLLRVFLVCKPTTPDYEYNARLSIELANDNGHEIHEIQIKNLTKKQHSAFGNAYIWKSLSYKLNLLDFVGLGEYDEFLKRKLNFHLYMSSTSHKEETLHSIDVNMKYIRTRANATSNKKNNSIVCSKCFWLQPSDYKDLFWWIEMHKQAGYRKIIFCNNSIPNTREMNEIFEANRNFIEMSQLTFLPNFMQSNVSTQFTHEYLSSYRQLGSYFHVDSDLFNVMMTNECFLNNTDKYKHVSVIDNDEIVMPRVNRRLLHTADNFNFISKLTFDQENRTQDDLSELEMTCDSANRSDAIDAYLGSFKTQKPANTFYFHMGFYLRDKQVKQIIEAFEGYLLFNGSFDYTKEHFITVIDRLSPTADHNIYNFTFVLKNKRDIDYAMNLCRIYRFLIEKFERNFTSDLAKYSERFHRFFYIGGLLSSFACGKSVHSTDVTFELSVHYPEPDKMYTDQAELFMIGYDYGQVSHFRHVNEFHKSSQRVIAISELILDLNYLNCFYKPIVEKYSKIKLF
jgi:hypothetical protein